ncbi:hypothetical protein [Variovorax ginsengisoli]|uniref:Lipoprotein n=1 Tax=Variovorax ginsengisoli TaxID=363844 RepID=A0ABT9SDU9_9BURK|nr:hypothetical protein [Variovorax ginsengisoli]MDP9902541.1 hypothetical protein [Variovorax ginsengisoli]
MSWRPRFLLWGACLLAAAGLSACHRASDAPPEDFTATLQSYLAEHGDLCLGKTQWPIDVTQHEIDIGERNARQMPVFERLGLVHSTVADVEVDDEGTLHRMQVRRFDLTAEGRKHYIAHAAGAASHDFCVAHLSLDHVVDAQPGTDAKGHRTAVVNYTYQVTPAPWLQDAEVQRVLPMVAGVLRGAGSARLQETFVQTGSGWQPVGLQGS